MTIFCDMLKLGSTAALDYHNGQNKGRYCKKELLFLLILLEEAARVGGASQRYGKPVKKMNLVVRGTSQTCIE